MGIVSWIRRLQGACRRIAPKPPPRHYREQLFPNLFVRQLEERRVLSGTPLTWDDGVEEMTFDAGSCADDGTADVFQIVRQGDDVQISVNGSQPYTAPLADVPNITVNGSGDDDTLIVDLSGGDPLPIGGITFNGMDHSGGGRDSLLIDRGSFGGPIDTVSHRFDRIGDGFIRVAISGRDAVNQPGGIVYTGLESVRDASAADQLVFQFTAAGEIVTLSDDGDIGDGESMVSSSDGTPVTFVAPGESLMIETSSSDGSNVDTIDVTGIDCNFDADLSIDGDRDDTLNFTGDTDLGTGDLTATAGSINIDQMISAQGAVVHLDAGSQGTLLVSGTIDVSNTAPGRTGGTVRLLGDRVGLVDNAHIDASGGSGGGTVLIGGDYQGNNPGIRNASRTFVGPTAAIATDAVTTGNGGTVIVWADEITRFYGEIRARGGAHGGDGGFVEVSGKEYLSFCGFVDTLAPAGKVGTLLLDPKNITVDDSGSATALTDVDQFADGGGANDVAIDKDTIDAAAANVVMQANNDITIAVDGTINITASGVTLTMQAGRSIVIRADITTNDGAVTLTANETVLNGVQDGDRDPGNAVVTMTDGTTIDAGDQDITIRVSTGPTTNNASGDITLENLTTTGDVYVVNQGPTAGSGIVRASADALLTAASIALDVQGAGGEGEIGTSGSELRATTTNLEARGQSGGVFVTSPTQGLTLGGAGLGGLTGVSTAANGDINIATSGGAVNVTETVSANGSGDVTLDAGTGGLNVNSAVTSGSGNIALTSDTVALAANLSSSGELVLQPTTPGQGIGLAGASGLYDLTVGELNQIQDGFGQIKIGRDNGTGGINLNAVTFNDPVTLRSPNSGTINVDGLITGAGDASVYFDGSGATTVLSAGITTAGNSITFSDNVQVDAAVTLDTTDGGNSPGGAAVDFHGTLEATAAVTAESLTIDAGSGGDVTFTGAVGASEPLDSLTIDAQNVDFDNTLAVAGNIDLDAGGTVGIDNAVTTSAGGSLTITNTGQLTVAAAADMTLAAAFDQDGTGAVSLAADIGANGNLSFQGPVTLADQASVGTATGTANFASTVSTGNYAFAVSADEIDLAGNVSGTSSIDFQPATSTLDIRVGGAVTTADLDLTAAEIALLQNGFSEISIGSAAHTNTTRVDGAITFNDRISLDGGSIVVGNQITGLGDASIALNAPTTLNADLVTTGEAIDITDSLLVSGARTIRTTGALDNVNGGAVEITGPIDGANAGGTDTLTIDAAKGTVDGDGDGQVILTNAVEGGAGAQSITGGQDLEGLTIDGGQIDLGNVRVEGAIAVSGTNIDLNGTAYQADESGGNETILFTGPVDLHADVDVTGAGGATDTVTFTGTVRGDADGTRSLSVTAGSGNVDMQGAIGGNDLDLTSFTVASAGDVEVPDITTEGGGGTHTIDITATGTLTIAGRLATDGGGANTATGDIDLNVNAVVLAADTVLDTNDDGAGADGTVELDGVATNSISSNPAHRFGLTVDVAANDFDASALTLSNLDHLELQADTVTLGATSVDDGSGNGGNAIEVVATTINLDGNLTTNANNSATGTGAVWLEGAVEVGVDGLTIDTRNSSSQADAAVTIAGDLKADDAANQVRSLTITAAGGGGGGDDGPVDVDNLGAGANGSLDGGLTISGRTVTTQAITTAGTDTGGDAAGGAVEIDGTGAVVIGGAINAAAQGNEDGGNVEVDATGANPVAIQDIDTSGGPGAGTTGGEIAINTGGGTGVITVSTSVTPINITSTATAGGGNITFGSPVSLAGDIVVSTGAGSGNVTFARTVRGDSDGTRSLSITAGTGNVDMQGAIGGNNLDLASFTVVSANHVDVTDITTEGGGGTDTIDVTAAGTLTIAGRLATDGGGAGTDTGSIDVDVNRVVLAADTVLDTDDGGAGADGAITIGDPARVNIDAELPGSAGLSVRSGGAAITIYGDIGSTVRVGDVDVDSTGGTVAINGDISTQGGNVDFSGVTGGSIDVTGNDGSDFVIDTEDGTGAAGAGNIDFTNVTFLAAGIALKFDATDGGGAVNTDGGVILPPSIDTARALEVDADRIATGRIVTTGGNIDLHATAASGTAITFAGDILDTTNDGADNAGQLLLATGGGRGVLSNGGNTVTFRTDGLATNDQAIIINLAIDAAGGEGLKLEAGDANVDINARLGAGTGNELGLLAIAGAQVDFGAGVEAAGIRATAQTAVDIDAAAALDIRGIQSFFEATSIANSGGGTVIDSVGGAGSVITFRPVDPGTTFEIGDDATGSDVSDAAIAAVQSSVGRLEIGHDADQPDTASNQSGAITINGAGPTLTANTSVTVQADNANVTIDSGIDLSAGAGSFVINGQNATTTIGQSLAIETDGGGTITINDSLSLSDGVTLTLESDKGGDGAGGEVFISGNVRGDGGGNENLTVNAGDGAVKLGDGVTDQIGTQAGNRFGDVSVTTTGAVVVNAQVQACTFTIAGAASDATFNETINLDNNTPGDVLEVTATIVSFGADADITTDNGGSLLIKGTGTGSVTLPNTAAAQHDLDGGFHVDGQFNGGVSLGENIRTTGDAIRIDSPTTLTSALTLDTTNATPSGAAINLAAVAASGAESLTLNGGTHGDITVSTASVGGFTVPASGTFRASGQIDTTNAGITITADDANATGTSVDLAGGAELNGYGMSLAVASDVIFGGTITSAGATGQTVLIEATTAGTSFRLGDDGTADVEITEASLALVDDTLEAIVIGDTSDQTGSITIDDASDDDLLTLMTGLTLRQQDGGTGEINLASSVTTGGGDFMVDGSRQSLNVDGAGGGTVTISSGGRHVVINDKITFVNEGDDLEILSGGGDVSLLGSLAANTGGPGGEDLTITAGAGEVVLGRSGQGDTFGATAAATDRLGEIRIVSAEDVTVHASLGAGAYVQGAGSGTTHFNAALNLDNGAPGDVLDIDDVSSVVFADAATVNTGSGGAASLDGDGTGTLTIGTGAWNLDGAFIETQFTSVSLGANITTSDDPVTFHDEVTLTGNVIIDTNGATAGNIAFHSTIAGDGNDLTLDAAARDVSLEGTLTARVVQITSARLTLDAELNTTNNGTVTITNSALATIGGTITSEGTVHFDGTGDINLDANILTTDPGAQIRVDSSAITLSGDRSLTTNDGHITLDEVLTDTPGSHRLTLTAGAGDVLVDDNVGVNGGNVLGGLAVVSARDVHFTTAEATLDIGGPVDINTATLTLDGVLNTTNGGTVTVTNTGLAGVNAKITSEGTVHFDGTGPINLDADIETSGGDIRFDGAVTLLSNVSLVSLGMGPLPGNLNLTRTLDGSHNLTLNISGTTTLTGAVGRATAVGDGAGTAITINSTGTTVFEQAVTTRSGIVQDDVAGEITFRGDVTVEAPGTPGPVGSLFNANVNLDGITFASHSGLGVVFGNAPGVDQLTLSDSTGSDAGVSVDVDGNLTVRAMVDGAQDLTLTVDGASEFRGVVGGTTPVGDGAGAALTVNSPGTTLFQQAVTTESGIVQADTAGGITFRGNVMVGAGDTDSVFNAHVTLDGLTFTSNGGLDVVFGNDVGADLLTLSDTTGSNAGVSIDVNAGDAGDESLTVQAVVDGAQDLTLAVDGASEFWGVVGGTTAIGDGSGAALTVNSAGATVFEQAVTTESGIVQNDAAGQLTFRGDVTVEDTRTDGRVGDTDSVFNAAVTLDGLTFTSNGGLDVVFGNHAGADLLVLSDTTGSNSGVSIDVNSGDQGDEGLTVQALVDGAQDLTLAVDGASEFWGVLGGATPIGDGSGAALTVNSSGTTTFERMVITESGIVQDNDAGRITFRENLTVDAGDTDSVFDANLTLDGLALISNGAVTLGNAGADQVTLSGGEVTIRTNGALTVNANVNGDQNLTLNAGRVLTMADRAAINAGSGTVNLEAAEDVTLASVQTTSTLTVTSATGAITDTSHADLAVGGAAAFSAASIITLGDSSTTDTANFDTLSLTGTVVTVTEDSDTELAGVNVTTLNLTSNGEITDSTGTALVVTGAATFNAATTITLGDSEGDTTNFGTLSLTGTAVTVTEDSSTMLAGVNADSLELISAGAIEDSTDIEVTGAATFNAGGNAIILGDNAGDTTNFGSLHLTGGDVEVSEDSDTLLVGADVNTLELTSAGNIVTDTRVIRAAVSIEVTPAGKLEVHSLGQGTSEVVAGNTAYASVGDITVHSDGGVEILNLAVLESAKEDPQGGVQGRVTNAPPLLRIDEPGPLKSLVPSDTVQELTGSIGEGGNWELGANFEITIEWDDGKISTVTRAELEQRYPGQNRTLMAGDKLVLKVGEEVSDYALEHSEGDSKYGTGVREGPIELILTRKYPIAHLITIKDAEVTATVTVNNDPKILLYDSLRDEHLNRTSCTVTTSVAGHFAAAEEMVVSEEPAAIVAPETFTLPETRVTPLRPPSRFEEIRPTRERVAEDGRELYMVKVGPDGEEVEKHSLPDDALADISGLFDKFKERGLPNGQYRIYLKEAGFPKRQLIEFLKSGESFGEPVREQGRGSNRIPDQRSQIPRQSEPVAEAAGTWEVDRGWERWAPPRGATVSPAAPPAAAKPAVEAQTRATTPPTPSDGDGSVAAAEGLAEISESPGRFTGPLLGTAVLTGSGLASYSARGCWEKSVDGALEDSEEKPLTRAARLCRRFRR